MTLLLGVFLYSTAVRELHYAFSAKYHSEVHNDKCDHHIHPETKDGDCAICKIDVNGLYDHEQVFHPFTIIYLPRTVASSVPQVLFSTEYVTHYLRGPPSVA